jgi:hypothetical protein
MKTRRKTAKRAGAEAVLCGYCGRRPATEHDHVPPQAMFAAPRPSTLITVPSCAICHRPTKKDDEYFRTAISMREDVYDHPDVAGGVLGAAVRSLSRAAARGYSHSFLSTVKRVELRSQAGLFIGTRAAYVADGERIVRVVERITRGLFFHHHHEPLGSDYEARVFHDQLVDWSKLTDENKRTIKDAARQLATLPRIAIGRAFTYARWHAPEDQRVSAWLMTFYDKVVFIAITAPRNN